MKYGLGTMVFGERIRVGHRFDGGAGATGVRSGDWKSGHLGRSVECIREGIV